MHVPDLVSTTTPHSTSREHDHHQYNVTINVITLSPSTLITISHDQRDHIIRGRDHNIRDHNTAINVST
eukprot:m.93101 g.93101  ORF g.93101 m.93101 type:complete len:69 (+) comp26603_c2_seq2:1717-1923(+)